jgi:hypothetical protein
MSDAAPIAIRASDPGDYDRLLQAALARGPLRGVVHLWSTDLDACAAADTAWPKMLECNSLSALFLAQACASRGLTLDGGIAFVTQASQQVIPADSTIAVAQVPVWGFNSVLRTEHPELRSASIDLGAHPADGDVVALIDELTSGFLPIGWPSATAVDMSRGSRGRIFRRRHQSWMRHRRWRTADRDPSASSCRRRESSTSSKAGRSSAASRSMARWKSRSSRSA